MDSFQFQQPIAALGELSEVQRQTVAALVSGHGDLAEVTSMIEARLGTQAVCPTARARMWGRGAGP
ncbi:MAG: hypothetical protein ACLPPF_11555, partial [Rhodomicrobium sp.]